MMVFYTMGYDAAKERNKLGILATIWMTLKSLMLNERKQSQKGTQ